VATKNKEGGGGAVLLFLLATAFIYPTLPSPQVKPKGVLDYHLLRFWGASPEAPRSVIEHEVTLAADAHGIDHRLFRAVIKVESGGNPRALSPVGARGLAQVMPANSRRCGLRHSDQLWDIVSNVRCGAKILSEEISNYNGDIVKALQAYNGGPRCVGRCSESIQYSAKVLATARRLG
jgi:soluble lytic murein transglycosylase-like protein